ncbi:E3 ubiquitin/ISG15 ligase TRIM25-like [Rhinoderma darwinii]|uniref:E3 ubiquitin/ISG15 ligase TRIM25-like n=1 Tax=Rhinoderma darwinii TaxID=43563 RepID=UPI003F67D490
MASADLRDELNCSICLSLYTDPVSFRCGHNFCRPCIVIVLDAQEAAGVYSCPDCRAEYPERPALEKNRKLGNIVERFLSSHPDMADTRVFCTYCTKSPVPAVKSCLQCENSLCDDHLTAHNNSVDHILTEPTGSFGNKKCSIHKKVLEYYCPQDAACLCVSCCLVGKHRGHQVEPLDEASEKKKEKLRKYLDELNPQKAKIQTRVQNLHHHKGNIQEKASEKRDKVSKLFMDIKKCLRRAEKKALSEISRQEERIVSQIIHLIKILEIQEDELSRKMRDVEEMCRVADPIRLLQESDITVCSPGNDEDRGGDGGKINSEDDLDVGLVSGQADVHVSDTKVQENGTDPITVLQESDQGAACSATSMAAEEEAAVSDLYEIADDLDEVLISLTVHRSMRDIVTGVTSALGFHVPDILLDVDTAHRCVKVSEDLKTATNSEEAPDRPESPGRFLLYDQVLSRCGFSSGRHYWEVEWNRIGRCDIGLSYTSIVRKGDESGIGDNNKSWCLILEDEEYSVSHNSVTKTLHSKPTCPAYGVFLDYEAGRLSFFELCNPIRHLDTVTASFTEPLHVAFYVDYGASVTITSYGERSPRYVRTSTEYCGALRLETLHGRGPSDCPGQPFL